MPYECLSRHPQHQRSNQILGVKVSGFAGGRGSTLWYLLIAAAIQCLFSLARLLDAKNCEKGQIAEKAKTLPQHGLFLSCPRRS